MTIAKPNKNTPQKPGRHLLIAQLERTTRNLSRLIHNINAYSCEPRTRDLFNKKSELQQKLESFRGEQTILLQKLRNKIADIDNPVIFLRKVKEEFRELEAQVLEYIGMAKLHGGSG